MTCVGVLESGDLAFVSGVKVKVSLLLHKCIEAFYHLFLIL